MDIADQLYNNLPKVYRVRDTALGKPLYRFLQVFAVGIFEPHHADIEAFTDLVDPERCPAQFLPYLAYALGFEFPHGLSEATQRKFIKVFASFLKQRGTEGSLRFLAGEAVGYPVAIYDEDLATRTFKIDTSSTGNDPEGEAIRKTIEKLLDFYKPVGSNFTVDLTPLIQDNFTDDATAIFSALSDETFLDTLLDYWSNMVNYVPVGQKTRSKLTSLYSNKLSQGFRLNHKFAQDKIYVDGALTEVSIP